MEESVQIAYTVAKTIASERGCNFLEKHHIHLNLPEGAIKKDGPSAGITITTAMLSLALETPVIDNLAMTGEISLTQKVLPIGGLKEKTVAAKREGVKTMIVPKANKPKWLELDEELREGLDVHFVENY
jgi:Lon-like ATP-dependent protease